MEFDVLIPTQHKEVAYKLLDYVYSVFEANFSLSKKIAKHLADAKYWEAYDCGDATRQEYWRQVKGAFDTIKNFR